MIISSVSYLRAPANLLVAADLYKIQITLSPLLSRIPMRMVKGIARTGAEFRAFLAPVKTMHFTTGHLLTESGSCFRARGGLHLQMRSGSRFAVEHRSCGSTAIQGATEMKLAICMAACLAFAEGCARC